MNKLGVGVKAFQLLPNQISCFKGLWAAGQQPGADVRFLNRGTGRNA